MDVIMSNTSFPVLFYGLEISCVLYQKKIILFQMHTVYSATRMLHNLITLKIHTISARRVLIPIVC